MKRIAVGQILQESNTLNPVLTRRADFEAFGLASGENVMGEYGSVGELAGFAGFSEEVGEPIEWLGLVRAVAWSSGPMKEGLLQDLLRETLAPLLSTPVDGVLLSLHGAQCSEREPDVAGRVLADVREAVGGGVPIVGTLDLHANVTRRIVRSADTLVGYHTHPHVDHVECGRRAARALAHMMRAGERPRIWALKIPMVVNDDGRSTDRGILAGLWRRIVAAEKQPAALSVSLFQVQPWLDVPELGWTLYQSYVSDDPPLAPAQVARECWETRGHADGHYLSPDEVVPAALAIPARPVVVSEGHDATNSGAPGDSTLLLAELASRRIPDGGALTFCVDGDAVARCIEVGEGATVSLSVGGKLDRRFCRPLALTARVVRLGDLSYRLTGHGGHNLPVTMGRAAAVTSGDLTLVLTETTGPGSSPAMYEAIGLDPRNHKLVVAKSPQGFRRDYEPFAAGILYCAAPGCSMPYLDEVGYRRVSRPVYPLDDIDRMEQAGWAGEMSEGEASG